MSEIGPDTTRRPRSRIATDVHTSASSVRMWLERNRLAHRSKLDEQIANLDARARIEIARGLVEDEHLRIVKQRARELETLLHALRHRRDELRFELREIGELHHRVDDGVVRVGRDFVRVGEELEVLAHGHALVDARVVRHVADDLSHGLGIDPDVEPVDLDAARERLEERRHDANGRRLARAVRTDEPEDLSVAYVEAHVAEHVELAEAVPQVAHANRGHGRLIDPRARRRRLRDGC